MEKVKDGSLILSVGENPNLCPSASCKAKKKFVVPIVATVSVLVLFFLSALVKIFWNCKRQKQGESNKEGLLKLENQEFTYSEVVSMTDNFKTVIGEGGFGKVYLGTLKNGNQVAVKLRSPLSKQGPQEFQTEAQLLMRIHHKNLLSLIGYCNEGTNMGLVYEYMAKGNLREILSGFINIDCGADEDHQDQDTGLSYEPDTEYIDTWAGTNSMISSQFNSTILRAVQWNLRSFPDGTKNCYTLRPKQGKNHNYMIRAYFNYGNYDGKNQAPKFDLYLGVNKWAAVEVNPDLPYGFFEEIIHFSSTDNIYVCLVNTGGGIPFISALELRPLDSSIYRIESGAALQHRLRYDVSELNDTTTRYPDDIYDRVWTSINSSSWYPLDTSSTIDSQSSNDTYYPPEEVLRTAAQTQNSSTPLTFSWTPPYPTFEHYVYFHFAEIKDVQPRELINISLNGVNVLTEPIKLEYLKPLTKGPLPFKGAALSFSIYATGESNLPPILNAFEIFESKKLPNSPTHQEDVGAIMDVKQVYNVKRNWQGDPCVPRNFSWDGLNCSYDSPPRIISLNLSSSGLLGEIASSLQNLTSIKSLDLSYNGLTGHVPEFLAQLPSLITLKLNGNKLSGSIPKAVMEKVKNESLNFSLGENPNLCQSDSCKAKKKFVIPLVVSIGAVLVLLSALVFWYYKRKIQGEYNTEGLLKSENQEFTYSEVVSMTDNFKTVIGEGGFGKVYLGTLENGNQVAIKLHSTSSKQGPQEFRTEAQFLMRVHHRNLVSLIGYCDKGKHMALVYEYMAKGNLRHHLSDTNANVLSWQNRLQIAVDAAQGLEYLHNGCKPPIIHRDIKTTNILLNEKLQAKIADFGLSKDFKNEGDTHVTADPAGTPAYIDPEYQTTRKLNKKSDVYSFGIVLLELITGKHAVIKDESEYITIIQWVRPIIERGDIQDIVDQRLQGEFNTNSAKKVVEIAMSCIPSTAIQRPDMSHVMAELKECLAIETLRMVNSETRPRNSHEMSTPIDLESDLASLAR